ncbi:E2F/DP family winged-helix DNA-binding domain-containing protein [Spironucleus salmonicida]|uniref:E2F/DP family winged-helix DNA-binding domain-containing protein n=1 Tax=Spironucleus salmonicida TaxID=348837 RepID=V6LCH1_9EUKA|nr:E2F/DP family winged-helix DNA-binding domain-containing protein [Spironucleus salmonicida]|eukprot:EST41371.1 E2F/DP family winged-helix DNA-binding domain-containing protein [Spironucleus salmonicida]
MTPSAICNQTIQLLTYAQSLPLLTEISVDSLSSTLGQPKRRIYDVLAVLEALGAIQRSNRSFTLTPNGIPGISSVSELTHRILNRLQTKQMTAKQVFKSLNCSSNEIRRGYDILQVLVGAGRLAVGDDGVFWFLQEDSEYIDALVRLALGQYAVSE